MAVVGRGDGVEHRRVGAGEVVAGERAVGGRGQLHTASIAERPRVGTECWRSDGTIAGMVVPAHYCSARWHGVRGASSVDVRSPPCLRWRSTDRITAAGPAAHGGRAAGRPGRPRAAAAGRRSARSPTSPRRPRPARRRSCASPPSSASTASAPCRRRSSATCRASCARPPSGSASWAATSRSRATGRRAVERPGHARRGRPGDLEQVVVAARRHRPGRCWCSPATPSTASACSSPRPRRAARRRRGRRTAARSPSAASSPSQRGELDAARHRPAPLRALGARGVRAAKARRAHDRRPHRRGAVAAGDGAPPLVHARRRLGVAVRQPRRRRSPCSTCSSPASPSGCGTSPRRRLEQVEAAWAEAGSLTDG